MAQGSVAIHLDQRRKLIFRHKDLRDAVSETGKSIGDLFTDPFGGWGHLLRYGLRTQDPRVTLDKASEFLDLWVAKPDPETNQERTLDQLGELLLEALNASGFVKITKFSPEKKETPEGNALPEGSEIRGDV